MEVHELKILPEYYDAVRCGDKRFEIRKNDRNFHTGDILRLKEWDGEKYTGEELDAVVRWILFDWQDAIKPGYCIMSIDTMMHSIPKGTSEHNGMTETVSRTIGQDKVFQLFTDMIAWVAKRTLHGYEFEQFIQEFFKEKD